MSRVTFPFPARTPTDRLDEPPATLLFRSATPHVESLPILPDVVQPRSSSRTGGKVNGDLRGSGGVPSRLGTREASRTMSTTTHVSLAAAAAGGRSPSGVPTVGKVHTANRADLMAQVRRYVESELQILAESGNQVLMQPNHQRLAVFRNGWAMVSSQLTADVSTFIERVMAEYECLLAEQTRQMRSQSMDAERKRLEAQYAASFARLKDEFEVDTRARRKQLAEAEEAVEKRMRELEEQGKALQLDNEKMKRQHDEDHDRAATLSNAIIDARLAMLEAETARGIAEKKLQRVQQAEAAKLDLLDDIVGMFQVLKKQGIDFTLKSRYMFDVL